MGIRREEEMEMSDDENCDSPTKKMRVDESGNAGNRRVPRGTLASTASYVGNKCQEMAT